MFSKLLKIFSLLFFIASVSVIEASAVCDHDFSFDVFRTNLIYNSDMTHSYLCRNGCGSIGTENGGVNSKEKCSFSLDEEKKSTCVEKGYRFYICAICYGHRVEDLPLSDHHFKKTRKLPTCTDCGYDLYVCDICGLSRKENIVEPAKHISDGGIIEIMPGLNKQGVLKESCRICGSVIERRTLTELFDAGRNECIPETVSGFRVKSYGVSFVKLIWNKTDNAVSYKISYSSDKKKWKTLTSDKACLTVKGLRSSCKYYFKITAIGNGCIGEPGKIISVCTKPERSVISSLKSTAKSVARIKWKNQNNVSGYEIKCSAYKFSENKKIKSFTVTKGSSKTVKRLKSGKKYYFRVRAFKKVGSKKIYGAYSRTKSVNIR